MPEVETSTPPNTAEPIGPYNHIAKVGAGQARPVPLESASS
jgi:hypothetical protein